MKKILNVMVIIISLLSLLTVVSCSESTITDDGRYNVMFKDYDGTLLKEEIVLRGQAATPPEDPIRYGYNFLGWDSLYANVQKDMILIAQYERDYEVIFEYKVVFKDYDGTILKEETVNENSFATAPVQPTREGYKFIGWDKEFDIITSDLVVTALYEESQLITVVFDSQGGTNIDAQNIEPLSKVTKPTNPVKDGYSFKGWYIDEEEWSFLGYVATENMTLVAKWEIITYEITYELNEGILTEENPTTYTVEDNITLINPIKDAHTFIGWTTEESTEPVLEVVLNKETGNKHYIANFEENKYSVKFIDYDGNVIKEEIVVHGASATAPEDPIKEGYTFKGWDREFNVIDKDLDVLARYEIINNTITLDFNGGFVDEPVTLEDVKAEFLKDVATHRNITVDQIPFDTAANWHAFWSWGTFMPTKEIDANNPYYPSEDAPSFFNVSQNREKWLWLIEVIYNTMIEFPGASTYSTSLSHLENAINKNYCSSPQTINYVIWYFFSGENHGYFGFIFSDTDGDGISNAQNSLNKYHVMNVNSQEFSLPNVYKEGYEFLGWTGGSITEPTKNIIITNINEDITYKAHFAVITYEVVLDVNGGDPLVNNVFELEYNSTFDIVPTKEGSTFLGWFYNNKMLKPGKWTIEEDATIQARWYDGELDIEFNNETGNTYIYFGKYPQTVVTDNTVINALSSITTTNEQGYFEYNGNEYAKVVAKAYSLNNTFTNGNTITNGNTYYFLVEPIKWRVLAENEGEYKLLAELILDCKQMLTYNGNRIIDGKTIYTNNYQYSDIRAWLNGYDGSSYESNDYTNNNFYDIAFSNTEQSFIQETFIQNSFMDKVYLLGIHDITNVNYGYNSGEPIADSNRVKYTSDFVRALGIYLSSVSGSNYGTAEWWLNDAASSNAYWSRIINIDGYANYMIYTTAYCGVVPSITINLSDSNSYHVVFKDYDGTTLKEEKVQENSSATLPTYPTRFGYEFVGWDKEYNNITSNLIINAIYSPITYNVTLDVNGGDPLEESEIEIAYDAIFDISPVRDGYTFIGWYNGDNLIGLGPWHQNEDLTLVAKWKMDNIAISTSYENGYTYINFGRYPQTVVTDTSIINALSTITTTNELGYYEYNGNEYAKVVANPYDSGYRFINGTTITKNNTYYFLVEPIKWRVLEENNGTYTLLSEMILDNPQFYNTSSIRTINDVTIYPNNYEYSNVRAWLNGYDGSSYNVSNYTNKGFLNIAFTEEEQALINTTLVDNSLESIADDTGSATDKYLCNDTNDKLYLLSLKELINENYGFVSSKAPSKSRESHVTDFVNAKGAQIDESINRYGNGRWMLRTPHGADDRVQFGSTSGDAYNDFEISTLRYSVRPAMTITLY